MAYQYCTPQWLEESARVYRANPEAREKLKKLTARMCYRVKADPAWGIDTDILFCAYFTEGALNRLELISEENAKKEADFLLSATPQTWKKILKKEKKFVTDFMLGNIRLEQGSKVGVLGIAPHANNIVDALTSVELVFSDDLPAQKLALYRSQMETFRKELNV